MGYSEPDYGSDVASITTRAVRDGDEWVINGAKMWTTMAHEAQWLILLTRTDPDVPKHKGLTMFLLPMDTPGITVEAVHTMGTERTNATFYDDVRVGDDCVLGEVDGGWNVHGRRALVRARRDGRHQPGRAAAAPLPASGREEPAASTTRRPRAAGARRDRQRGRHAAHAALGVDRGVRRACPASRVR